MPHSAMPINLTPQPIWRVQEALAVKRLPRVEAGRIEQGDGGERFENRAGGQSHLHRPIEQRMGEPIAAR